VPAYFDDSSALGKRYVAETGSAWVQSVLEPANGATVYVVRTTAVEIIAAISRRERGGSIAPRDALTARSAFRNDLANEYQIVELTEPLAVRAMHVAEKHGLRGYDAIQLAAAIELNTRRIALGMTPMVLISSDGELNSAAAVEGLPVDDPNKHP
jgi:uncharacterized protein